MQVRNPEETKEELIVMLTDALGRPLSEIENEIVADIVAYPDEKRIAYLEMMKNLLNEHNSRKPF